MADKRTLPFHRRFLAPLLFVLLLARIAATAIQLLFLIPTTLDISFPEGAVVARAVDVAHGTLPYHDWRSWPHAFAPYGPLTYYPVGWLAGLSSSPPSAKQVYGLGRMQSLLFLAGICVLIAGFTKELGNPIAWGSAGIAAFLMWLPLAEYATSYRPDAPQVFFALLALWIATRGPARGPRIVASLACLWISMWFKPSSWGIAAALAYWLGRERGTRQALVWAATFGLSGLLLAAILNWRWDGLLFLNMIGSLDNGWKFGNVPAFYSHLPLLPGIILLSGVCLAIYPRPGNAGSPRRSLILAALVGSFAATTLQNLKVGADINYYLEPYALACAVTVWGIARLWRGETRLGPRFGILILALAVLPAFVWDSTKGWVALPAELKQLRRTWESPRIVARIGETDGPILTSNPFLAVAKPDPPTILDHVQYMILLRRDRLSDAGLLDRLQRKEFSLVILPTKDLSPPDEEGLDPLFSPRFLRALHASYRETERFGILSLMEPIPPEP